MGSAGKLPNEGRVGLLTEVEGEYRRRDREILAQLAQ